MSGPASGRDAARAAPPGAAAPADGVSLRRGTLRAAVAAAAVGLMSMLAPGTLSADPGYLVAVPDRGFLGNEESRDQLERLREAYPRSELWVVTDERPEEHLREALEALRARDGVDRVVVLPLFLTRHHALYGTARRTVASLDDPGIEWADPLGASHLAEEVLFDRVEALSRKPASERLVVVGSGAASPASADSIRRALAPLAERAARKHGLAGTPAVEVLYHGSAPDSLAETGFERVEERVGAVASDGHAPVVVPFGLARRYTTMMSDWNWLGRRIRPHEPRYAGRSVVPHGAVSDWLRKTATRHRRLARDEVGVIFVPHGSDYGWNETMREGLEPLRDEYVTEDAFSMVDPVVLERAVRRLEERGVRAAVVVRIFSLESSFREKAEYVLGLRRDHDRFPHRIRSPLEFHTLGGMETSPHLADALADRVRDLSRDPSRETVLLLAHGAGDEARHEHWMDNLAEIADEVRERTGDRFRAYRYHAWREDWPEHREPAVAAIREMVRDASKDGGTALVVPVRTAARGPAGDYLEGMDYREGEGFAPHPSFTAWLRETVERGVSAVAEPAGDGGEPR